MRRPTSGLDSSSATIELDRPAVDAARLVDAVDRHLHADQRGLAAGRGGARQRLQRADLVGLGLAEGRPPRRRHQHGRAERARRYAVADHAAARDLAAMPKRRRVSSVMVNSSPVRSDKNRGRRHERLGEGLVRRRHLAGWRKFIELIAERGGRRRTLLMSPQGPRHAVPTIRRHSIKSAQSYTLAKACQQPVGACEKPRWRGFPALPRQWAGAAGR